MKEALKGEDLQNLGIGDSICRIERAEYDFNLKTLRSPPIDPALTYERHIQIVEISRQKYAARKEEVEAKYYREDSEGQAAPKTDEAKKEEQRKTKLGKDQGRGEDTHGSETFLAFLENRNANTAAKEETVRGYKVKTKFKALDEKERKLGKR